uniref:Uncharacterized protein n=1 Tax=Rhizophagus irregularis (strain DAOM 181602 / DAOM 197198 / MUCL 43194) TaxID=747089 RepID=U9SMT0_RHIID
MSKLNKSILFLIFKELQDDPKSLFSCLIVINFGVKLLLGKSLSALELIILIINFLQQEFYRSFMKKV